MDSGGLQGHDALKDRLKELLIAGSVWICWPIRAELLIGVKASERMAILNEQLAALEQAPILDQTWDRAARLGHQLARKGQSVPLPDLLIAATALLHDLPIINELSPRPHWISICSEPISQRYSNCTERNCLTMGVATV
ncbi:MAG: PIN domain nuclease [Nitrospira sp. CG24A]|nr:MAG: PIN domain nuclease [Nitrospira sp. CG24A]